MTKDLQNYLENGDMNLFRVNKIEPHVFIWPEDGLQTKKQLLILEKDKNSIFYKTIIFSNTYGPAGIKLYNNIQLDRVHQVWSIYILVNKLNLDLNNNNEIIFEFGGGTGQMADVLNNLEFKGKHIVYDLPLMTILQKFFVDKRNITTKNILDNDKLDIIYGTNFIGCNQIESEKQIVKLPNINFIATYSVTETDQETHDKFAKYISKFKRILIIYWPQPVDEFDNIDNELYIRNLEKDLEKTHDCYINTNYGNGNIFSALKK